MRFSAHCLLHVTHSFVAVADVGILVSTSSSPSTALAGTTPGNVSTGTSTTRLLQQQQCSTTFVDCVKGNVRGTTITCKAACQGTCCVGGLNWQQVYFEACDFFTGQVCKDGKSCTGASACSGAYIPTVVNRCMQERSSGKHCGLLHW